MSPRRFRQDGLKSQTRNDNMKALIRNKGETITEVMQIDGIDWTTGAPLTNIDWSGGPYKLIVGYDPKEHGDLTPEELNNLFCNTY